MDNPTHHLDIKPSLIASLEQSPATLQTMMYLTPPVIFLVCVYLSQVMPHPTLHQLQPQEEYRITRGRSALGAPNTVEEERKRRHILSLLSDVLATTWAMESLRGPQGSQGLGTLGGLKITNDNCYQEACEGRACQCCNCYDCWAC